MSYMEGIFQRVEFQIDVPTESKILDWLRKDSVGNIVREETSGLRRVASEVSKPFEIKENIEEAKNFVKLKSARDNIEDIKIERPKSDLRIDAESRKQEIITSLKEARAESKAIQVENRRAFALGTDVINVGELDSASFERSNFRSVNRFANVYGLSESEAISRVEEFGFSVIDGKII